jgi:2',3'-cyclic-nucleotide 2'-phosphodiesterase (5'-nucleotidase family)
MEESVLPFNNALSIPSSQVLNSPRKSTLSNVHFHKNSYLFSLYLPFHFQGFAIMKFTSYFSLSLVFHICCASPLAKSTDLAIEKREEELTLHILHFNDAHAYLQPVDGEGKKCVHPKECYGGWARSKDPFNILSVFVLIDTIQVIGMINHLRNPATEGHKKTLVFDAGDEGKWKEGTGFWNYLKMTIVPKYLNSAGLDAWTVGNHDFDDGEKSLAEAIKQFTFPALGGNIISKTYGDGRIKSQDSVPKDLKKLEPYTVFPDRESLGSETCLWSFRAESL